MKSSGASVACWGVFLPVGRGSAGEDECCTGPAVLGLV